MTLANDFAASQTSGQLPRSLGPSVTRLARALSLKIYASEKASLTPSLAHGRVITWTHFLVHASFLCYTLIGKLTHAMLKLCRNYCFTSLVLSPSRLVFDYTFILSLLYLVSILLPGKVVGDVMQPL